ncbi:MAG TPA: AAA family ATPase, partial [Aquella sp.]|nr:AAA family ATPase [Aquella sp.]
MTQNKLPENSAFTNQLISLAAKELSLEEKNSLSLIISALFNDLDLGHSCSILSNAAVDLSLDDRHCEPLHSKGVLGHCEPLFTMAWQSFNIIKLLLKSNLACEYSDFPLELKPLPISILNIKNKQLVYITKYLQYELDILNKIKLLSDFQDICYYQETSLRASFTRRGNPPDYAQYNSEPVQLLEGLSARSGIPNQEQLQAIINSLKQKFSIITGGPGTGKTTTVAILLWLLYQNYGNELKVKICAPTGKASKRVKDSIQNSINHTKLKELDFSLAQSLLDNRNNFLTIHKLLGYQANSIYFKHNKNNPLDLDVLIVDESSMVSLPLFSKLLQAIDMDKIKHVILLGDKNQLSSVEEGYVFASLVNAPSLKQHVSSLAISNRSNKEIGDLAAAVQAEETSLRALFTRRGNPNKIKSYKAKLSDLFDKQLFSKLDNSLSQYFKYVMRADLTDIQQLFEEFNRQIVLCLTNVGLFGTIYLNAQIEKKVKY